jgi:hypothetical protein
MAYSANSIYGVQLLDDLHNYFPELLYNSGRFQNVQEVLQYMTSVTRRRFDLFTHGREVYSANLANAHRTVGQQSMDIDSHAPVHQAQSPVQVHMQQAPVPAPVNPTPVATAPSLLQPIIPSTGPNRRAYASLFTSPIPQQPTGQTPAPSQLSSLDALLQLLQPPALTPIITTSYTTTDEDATGWLMSLLSGGRGFGQLPASFLEPIPVFPTREQVHGASTIRMLDASDTTTTCTICQDDMSEGNTIRTLNACHHTFHISCIDTWLTSNVRCPICRHDIRERTGSATEQKDSEDDDGGYNGEDEIEI